MPYEGDALGSLSLTIGLIVAALAGALWLARRMRPGAGLWGARDCTVLRSLPLGPRERVMVIRIGERQLVIGVGSASVSLLCELPEPLAPPGAEGAFADNVRKALGKWREP